MTLGNEQRRIVAYLDGLQAKVNAFPLASLGDDVRGYSRKVKRNWMLCCRPPKVRPAGGAFKGEL